MENVSRRKKCPDRLSQDATVAILCGMSYGKYKALHPRTEDLQAGKSKEEKPKYERICRGCGKAFQTNKGSRWYCDDLCKRRKENERHRERAKAAAECGGEYGENVGEI